MSSQRNSANCPDVDMLICARCARVIGTEAFRKYFHSVAHDRRVDAGEPIKPSSYAAERAKRQDISKLNLRALCGHPLGPHSPPTANLIPAGSLFLPSDFNLRNTIFNPFPLYLPRPEYMEVPRESIEAIDPILADDDVSYIRDGLAAGLLGPSMFPATENYRFVESNSEEVCCIIVDDPTAIKPTHILEVKGYVEFKRVPRRKSVLKLIPVHSLVLAANCAKLAHFPPQITPIEEEKAPGESILILPIVSIFLESYGQFPILLEYLYLKCPDRVFRLILSWRDLVIPRPDEHGRLAEMLAERYNATQLLDILKDATNLWENICYLGVYDDELWDVLDLVRKMVFMALAILQGRLDTLESIKAVAAALDREREPTGGVKMEEPELMDM